VSEEIEQRYETCQLISKFRNFSSPRTVEALKRSLDSSYRIFMTELTEQVIVDKTEESIGFFADRERIHSNRHV